MFPQPPPPPDYIWLHLAEAVFRGSPSLLATCILLFLLPLQSEATHFYSSLKNNKSIDTTSVCHGTQECGSLLVACSSFSVCCVSCSAAVLFSAVLPHLLQSEHLDLSLCRPPPTSPHSTSAQKDPPLLLLLPPPSPPPNSQLTSLAKPQ